MYLQFDLLQFKINEEDSLIDNKYFMNIFVNTFKFIKKEFRQSNIESEALMIPYGILGIFGFIIFYFINQHLLTEQIYENWFLRTIAALFSLILILKNYWPNKTKKYVFLVWNVALTINIPFFFTFMLLKNDGYHMWPIYWALAITLLILLVNLIPFLILTFTGIMLAVVCYIISTPFYHLPINIGGLLASYISFSLYYIFISQKKRNIQEEKIRTLSLLAATIAHEMRTPLMGIASAGIGLEKALPSLIKSYDYATKNNETDITTIPPQVLHHLPGLPERIKNVTDHAFLTIDILLMNLKRNDNVSYEICSINQCIQTALEKYPLDNREEKMVQWIKGPDFQFIGSPLLIHHIFFNLLKNSLFYVKKAGKGSITITVSEEKSNNIVYFKDTGHGIDKNDLKYIFDQFYSKNPNGSGIGLAFCKRVMRNLGGDIHCKSELGVFTEFRLEFPKTNSHKNADF